MKYTNHVSTRQTVQQEPVLDKDQQANNAGGFVFAVDKWTRLERFLILGNEDGTYYQTEKELTQENAQCIWDCYKENPTRTIQTIVNISNDGRAVKNDPAIFALAMLSNQSLVLNQALPKVCRTSTHLFQFIDAAQHFRGRGRAFNRAIRNWYLSKPTEKVSYQLVKYQQRNGWSHKDVLRLVKPKVDGPMSAAFGWAVDKPHYTPTEYSAEYQELTYIEGFERAKVAKTTGEIVKLIHDYQLVREAIPTKFLKYPAVWEALLEKMPFTAMIRNLGKMTSVGLLQPLSDMSHLIANRLRDQDKLHKARIHPYRALVAQKVYGRGQGIKGKLQWKVDPAILDALEDAFYLSFDNVEITGKKYMIGIDCSGSMNWASHAVANGLIKAREAAASMAMCILRKEEYSYAYGFSHQFIDLGISPAMRLDTVVDTIRNATMGATDCALPIMYALTNKINVDIFIVLTDNETWYGDIHPFQALQQYREHINPNAKLATIGMSSTGFTIADPNDAGMLDVVGMDTAVPQIITNFVKS